jgi:hypothetical protein
MRNYVQIDRSRVLRLLNDQDLKRWWVAERVGVHKTTLRRWLSGKIARIHAERLQLLAGVLEVSQLEITLRRTAPAPLLDIACPAEDPWS